MSQTLDDTNHPVRFKSPLGSDLVVRSLTGEEALGQPFCYNLELLSNNPNISFNDIVGQQVTVILDLADDERHFNGYVTEFRYLGSSDRYSRYQATLRPWLWFLTRTSDCKIFQEMTVPDIIKAVFRDNGFAHFEDRLNSNYRTWEYCVQYRETDFNFVSRLMEQEGIYYYFEHRDEKHVLVLADDMSAHNAFPGFDTIAYHPPTDGMSVDDDYLEYWAVTQSIQPERYAVQDFDFTKPRADLAAKLMEPGEHAYPLEDSEIYDYPGEYSESNDGQNYVSIRLEELRGQMERVSAGGPCRGLSAGCKFTLENYPRDDQNKDHLVIYVSHQISESTYISSGDGDADELYHCQAELMDSGRPYRQTRSTPKPVVQGPQTAIVVGPSDEEIYTDEYGRVKVQFHWDRYGQRNENSSCWVRVSQYWAGNQWGSIHIPRIDQEVIVSFMEGDPDKPVITGRLYNAVNMPPYDLPANKTQSGVKSRSSKDGTAGNFNEIRMEDKKGSEELYIHAEKNHTNITENDRNENVGRDRFLNVGRDKSEDVGRNKKVDVAGTHTETITMETSVIVTEGNYSHDVQTGTETRHVKSNVIENFDDNQHTTVKNNIKITSLNGSVFVVAKDEIQMVVGDSMLSMKKDGTIVLSGKDILVTGSDKVSVGVGSQNVTCDKQKVASTGAAINSSAVGMHEITGAVVKIN